MKISTLNKATKAIVSIPGWQQSLLNGDGLNNAQQAYQYVPLIYRAVKLRCDSLSAVPVYIKDKNDKEQPWPFASSVDELIWKTEAALLGSGKAIIIKVSNTMRVLDLQWVNPFTVTVTYENGITRFTQGDKTWDENSVVYIKEFSYSDDITSGISAVEVAMSDAALLRFQTRFASAFFENGAMPIVLLSTEGTLDDDEKVRIQGFFNKLASGVNNAFRALATRTKLNAEVVSQDIEKMAMPDLYSQAVKNVAHAFGLPINMLMGDDNYASAEAHNLQYWDQTIKPRARKIANAFNKQLLAKSNLHMEFAFDEMSIYQEDENNRSTSYSNYVGAGMRPSIAAQILGIDLPEGITPEMLDAKEPEPTPPSENPQETQFDADLAKWERKCLKRVKDGKSADCAFESEFIPAGMVKEIRAALKLCKDADEIKAVFEGREGADISALMLSELTRAIDLLEKDEIKE